MNKSLTQIFQEPSVQYTFAARNAHERAIIVSNRSGKYQLHAVDFTAGFERQITRKEHGKLFGSISPDGRYIYVLDDKKGDEHGHFLRIPFKKGKTLDVTPNIKQYFSYSISSSIDGKVLCFTVSLGNKNRILTTSENRSGNWTAHEVYSANTSLSESICSTDGKSICVAETDSDTKTNILTLFPTTDNKIAPVRSRRFAAAIPLAFSRISEHPAVLALVRTNDWYRPIMYDFARRHVVKIYHSSLIGDVWVLGWDEEREQMILCNTYQARQKLYLYNTRTHRPKRLGPRTGSFSYHFDSIVTLKDGSFVLKWQDFNTSPRLIKIHAPHYKTWKEISEWSNHTASKYVIENTWARSSDGQRVQMWVAQPRITNHPTPFIIDIHGGPHGVAGNEFSPEAQAWLANGFGYCAVNYRGSISFGKKFEEKIYGNPGHWEVEDVVAARNWLVKGGYADPKHIVLHGWSWGGYVTLLALGKYPNLWSGGIAGTAITDCIMQYEDEPAYFKAIDKKRFGGTPEENQKQYIRSSPITYLDNTKAPILIFHGSSDVRCPPRQIKYFEQHMRALRKDITVKWFSSGHTGEYTNTKLRVSLFAKALQFANRIVRKKNP